MSFLPSPSRSTSSTAYPTLSFFSISRASKAGKLTLGPAGPSPPARQEAARARASTDSARIVRPPSGVPLGHRPAAPAGKALDAGPAAARMQRSREARPVRGYGASGDPVRG